MIEIRPAKPDELLRQKELWKLAFGDEDDYIDYFFAHGEESQVLVLLEDGVVYTMVALFPVALALPGGRKASSAYIYALATHPDARKKGFGRYILSYVDFYLKERGADCVTIVPAEVSLHKFFGTTGFSECFSTRKVELLRSMVGVPAAGDTLERVDPETYNRLREELLAETLHVVYSDSLVAYQEGLSRMANGALFRLRVAGSEGLACTEYLDDDTVMVKELLIPRPGMAGAAALIGAEMPAVLSSAHAALLGRRVRELSAGLCHGKMVRRRLGTGMAGIPPGLYGPGVRLKRLKKRILDLDRRWKKPQVQGPFSGKL